MTTDENAATTCSDEHSRFCSPCDTAKRYNSLHCGECGVPVPPRANTASAAQPVTRLSVNINAETAEFLKGYAAAKGCTITEAVRRAVAVLKFMHDETEAGHTITAGNREVHFVG